jgi:hypothetical protein
MSLLGLRRYRTSAGAAALIGVFFYAALIPLHTVSQALSALAGEAAPGISLPSCHEGATATRQDQRESYPDAPAKPQKRCPFCQGYAAFQLAIAAGSTEYFLLSPIAAPALRVSEEGIAGQSLPRPQSRGPPARSLALLPDILA